MADISLPQNGALRQQGRLGSPNEDAQFVSVSHDGESVLLSVLEGDLHDILEFTPERAESVARQLWAACNSVRHAQQEAAS